MASMLVVAAAISAYFGGAPALAKEVTDCTNSHSNCFSLAYTDAKGQSHALTDSQGHPIAVDQSGKAQSGQTVTVQGWNWKLNQRFEVWLSEPFTDLNQEPNVNECYIRVTSERSPAPTSLSNHPNAPGTFSVNFTIPEIPHSPQFANGAKFVVEVGSPGIGCIGGNGSHEDASDIEDQAQEIIFTAFPTPVCVPALHSPCLDAAPGVVYPGGAVTVSGQGWNAKAGSVGIYLGVGNANPTCTNLEKTVTLDPSDPTGTFSTTITAPPLPTLPVSTADGGQLPAPFQVYAVSPAPPQGACTTTNSDVKTAPLYVSQPTLSVSSSVHSNDTVTIKGTHWLTGDPTSNQVSPVAISVFVGNDKGFACSSAKAYTTTSQLGETPNDGTFTVSFPAEHVDSDLTKQVRVVAMPVGTTLAAACDSATNSACAQSQLSTNQCPLMVVVTALTIIPIAVPALNWLYILIPLLLLLLLLPLFFWLGRHDEKEVIYTEQDVTLEREVSNTTAPSKYADALYARSIRITREVINLRTGKVLDMEVEEYDVFRDAQGKEVRRLRPPTVTATVVTAAPATSV